MTPISMWHHVAGIYMALGVISVMFGMWIKAKVWGQKTDLTTWHAILGFFLGITLWLPILIVLPVVLRMKRKSKKLEKYIGYCDHYDVSGPYCPQCESQIKKEEEAFFRNLWKEEDKNEPK